MSDQHDYCNCIMHLIKTYPVTALITAVFLLNFLLGLFKRAKSLKDDIAFISGAASGIGRQTALKLSSMGAKVVIADIDMVKANQVVNEITAQKRQAMAVHCDVTSIESISKAVKQVREKFGNPSILINNAGIVSGKPILDLSYEAIERTFKVNAISHFYTIKEMLPDMLAANKGHIVTIASVAGLGGVSKMTDYCASKYAAVGIDDSLRNELKSMNSNVKTTCVCPYYIDTGMFSGVTTKFNFLCPMLKEEWVAERIVKAIRYDEPMVIMPKILNLAVLLKGLLPVNTLDTVSTFLGFQKSMDTFKGRH